MKTLATILIIPLVLLIAVVTIPLFFLFGNNIPTIEDP